MPKNKKTNQKENSLEDLLMNKLKALYDTENQLIKALPKMAKNATDPDLKKGFEKHLQQTKDHARRIERVFQMMGEKNKKLAGDAIRGLTSDADWVIKNVKGKAALDANLIAAAQYVEHYEIAGYKSAISWAKRLGMNDAADTLQDTLDEEQETSDTLKDLSSSKIDEKVNAQREDNNEEAK